MTKAKCTVLALSVAIFFGYTPPASAQYAQYVGFVSYTSADNKFWCLKRAGSEVSLDPCSATSPSIVPRSDGQIELRDGSGNWCLEVGTSGTPVEAVACGKAGSATEWLFSGGLVVATGANLCLWNELETGARVLYADSCTTTDTGSVTNQWMPVGLPFYLNANTPLMFGDLDLQPNPGSSGLEIVGPNGPSSITWESWFLSDFSTYVLQNAQTTTVLDLSSLSPSLGVGAVDLAAPNGAPGKLWYFTQQTSMSGAALRSGKMDKYGNAYCLTFPGPPETGPVTAAICGTEAGNAFIYQEWQGLLIGDI